MTIAVPTIGRRTLPTTLDSIARQTLAPGDRVIVAYDSYEQRAELDIAALVASYGSPFELHEINAGYHFFGNPQLNYAIELADTDFFCALGDDDVYVDGALDRLRKKLQTGRALLFQFLSPLFPTQQGPQRFVLWDRTVLREANISGCCLVAPTEALVPVKQERRIEVDFDWICDVVKATGRRPVWMKDCLIIARPDERNGSPVHLGVTNCRLCDEPQYLEDVDANRLCPLCVELWVPA